MKILIFRIKLNSAFLGDMIQIKLKPQKNAYKLRNKAFKISWEKEGPLVTNSQPSDGIKQQGSIIYPQIISQSDVGVTNEESVCQNATTANADDKRWTGNSKHGWL